MKEYGNTSSLRLYGQSEKSRRYATLCERGNGWGMLNSGLKSIASDFSPTLPNYQISDSEYSLRSYLEDNYSGKKVVLLEMGGLGKQLAIDMSEFLSIDQSAGVTLPIGLDRARYYENSKTDNWPDNHSIIKGDMFLFKTKREISKWLNGKKVDVLIERMGGGLDLLPDNPVWLYKNLNHWYHLLNDNGVMFIEVPPFSEHIQDQYLKWIDHLYEVKDIYNLEISHKPGSLRIKKLAGARIDLPFEN